MGKAANHSSGHAGVERSNELLMRNGQSSKLKSTTDSSVLIFLLLFSVQSAHTLSYDLANQVRVAAGQISAEAERNNDALG